MAKEFTNLNLHFEEYYRLYLEFYLNNSRITEISKSYNDKVLRIGAEHNSYRVISHWEKLGIIDSNRPNNKGWRKYSFVEGVWLRIVNKLREFNSPLEKVKTARESLKSFPKNLVLTNNPYPEYPLLEYHLYLVKQKKPVILIVLDTGEIYPLEYQEYIKDSFGFSHHLLINLNHILIEFTKDTESFNPYEEFVLPKLTIKEEDMLEILRENDWEEVKFIKVGGEIDRVVRTTSPDPNSRIHELMRDDDYLDAHIKKRSGKIVHIKKDITYKL